MTDGSLRSRPEFWPVTLLSVALIAVLGGWAGVTYVERTRKDPPCAERTTLRVAAAPSITPPVRQVATRLTERQRCLDVIVEARESAEVLRTIANSAPERLAAASAAPSPSASGDGAAVTEAPDVWLPESTLWLRRARAVGAFQVPAEGVSVAGTPIVLALDPKTAGRLGKGGDLAWKGLVDAAKPPVAVLLPDPAISPLGFGGLVGIRSLAKWDEAGTARTMRRLSKDTVSTAGEAAPDPTGPGKDETAVVSTEQQVLLSTTENGEPQVAVYPPDGVPGPDYPYAVLTSSTEARDTATALLRAMLAADGAAAFTEHGLRTPAGAAPAEIPAGTGISKADLPPTALPAEADTEDLLNAWGGVHISARMLAVFDISGSMAAAVPGSGETRMSATIKAAQEGSNLLLSTTDLGVWEFSIDLDGKRDYREVIPVGPLGPRRAEMLKRVGEIKVKPDGGTGLYNTTLAAYQNGTRNWTPGRINMVLILTDGADDNADGITRTALLRELGGLVDRKRPLPILFIGVGPDIDKDELNQIAKVTGGSVALTAKPSGIREIFYTALAQFSCLPPECRR
ncbi:substrate-binding and VWA domain-containing protein [Actinoplanes sp. NPDC051861]|uniref:substrate-binding and VWA domain-containing protein n=1 Tax=Actinoplanes sp. NPDC051861 TaxID=3155170 RepID=UPI003419A4FA